ncbi:MAG: methionyl-tRNA formyltransferase [Polyangiaceae bacterium]
MPRLRTVFFGTPAIAVPALRALGEIGEVLQVICQPDRPAGRGLELTAPPVKKVALELGLPVHQPTKVKTGLDAFLRELSPDLALVIAYGRILPESVLEAPRLGCLNLHASLLPAYRGAAPIQWAVARGETTTGVSLMQMDAGLDTGPVFFRRSLDIGPDETAGELAERIGELAALMVREDVPRVATGELRASPQDAAAATYAPPIEKDDARIDWGRPAKSIVDLVRGMAPRPGAHTRVRGKLVRVTRARVGDQNAPGDPGRVRLGIGREILVATASGSVEILRAQLEGKKELASAELVNGRALVEGDVLG